MVFIISFITTTVLTNGLSREKDNGRGFSNGTLSQHTSVSYPRSHLFFEHMPDDIADVLKAGRVSENLLLAGLDDAVHGFQNTHYDLALRLCSHRLQKARKYNVQ